MPQASCSFEGRRGRGPPEERFAGAFRRSRKRRTLRRGGGRESVPAGRAAATTAVRRKCWRGQRRSGRSGLRDRRPALTAAALQQPSLGGLLRRRFVVVRADRGQARPSAAIRSGAAAGSSACGCTAISSPAAFRSIRSSTCSRYSSLNLRGRSGRQRLDQLLAIFSSRSLGSASSTTRLVEPVRREHLVPPQHRRQRQHVAGRSQRAELLLAAEHDLADPDLALLAHRVEQQPVGLGAAGRQAPGSRSGRSRSGRSRRGRRTPRCRSSSSPSGRARRAPPVRSARTRSGRDLVPLDDLLVGDLFVGRGVDPLLADAHSRLARQLVEPHRLR